MRRKRRGADCAASVPLLGRDSDERSAVAVNHTHTISLTFSYVHLRSLTFSRWSRSDLAEFSLALSPVLQRELERVSSLRNPR